MDPVRLLDLVCTLCIINGDVGSYYYAFSTKWGWIKYFDMVQALPNTCPPYVPFWS